MGLAPVYFPPPPQYDDCWDYMVVLMSPLYDPNEGEFNMEVSRWMCVQGQVKGE